MLAAEEVVLQNGILLRLNSKWSSWDMKPLSWIVGYKDFGYITRDCYWHIIYIDFLKRWARRDQRLLLLQKNTLLNFVSLHFLKPDISWYLKTIVTGLMLARVSGVPGTCEISGHHVWHPRALFCRTEGTPSFKCLTQALCNVYA